MTELTAAVDRERARVAKAREMAARKDERDKVKRAKASWRFGMGGMKADLFVYTPSRSAEHPWNGYVTVKKDDLSFRIIHTSSSPEWHLMRRCEDCGNVYDAGRVAAAPSEPEMARHYEGKLTPGERRKKAVAELRKRLDAEPIRGHVCVPGASARLLELARDEAARLKTSAVDLLYRTAEAATR